MQFQLLSTIQFSAIQKSENIEETKNIDRSITLQ